MNKTKRFVLAIMICFSIGMVASQDVKAEITNFPNGLSSWGFPVLPGIGSNIFADVNIYWVDSQDPNSADGAGGGTAESPFKTIDFAVGQCTANNGDVILVKPGHIETVSSAGALDLDVAGITVIAIGNGSDRATIRLTSATTADVDFDAANVKLINFLVEARVDSLAQAFDINAADVSLFGIETRDIDGIGSCTNFIVADANADRLLIDGWLHKGTSTTSGAAGSIHPYSALSLTGGDDIVVKNFNIYGNFLGGGIIATTTSCTRLNINGGANGSYIWTENSTDTAITVLASTGWIGPNIRCMLKDNAANITEALVGPSMQFVFPNPICNLAGEQTATSTNITASTDG